MGRFRDLTSPQRAFLLRLAQASQHVPNHTWSFVDANDRPLTLVPERSAGRPEGELPDVSSSPSFYMPLERQNLVAVVWGKEQSVFGLDRLTMCQGALDYAAYVRKPVLGRWLTDLAYDLGHEPGPRGRLIWLLVTLALAAAEVLIIKALGWL